MVYDFRGFGTVWSLELTKNYVPWSLHTKLLRVLKLYIGASGAKEL